MFLSTFTPNERLDSHHDKAWGFLTEGMLWQPEHLYSFPHFARNVMDNGYSAYKKWKRGAGEALMNWRASTNFRWKIWYIVLEITMRRWMGLLFPVFWGTQRTFKFLGKEGFCSPFLGPCQTWSIMFSWRQTNPTGYRSCSRNWKVTDSDKWQLVQYSWGSNYRWNNVGLK